MALLGQRDRFQVPGFPSIGSVAATRRMHARHGSNANRIRALLTRNSFKFAIEDPTIVSTSGRPNPGPISASKSIAWTTLR